VSVLKFTNLFPKGPIDVTLRNLLKKARATRASIPAEVPEVRTYCTRVFSGGKGRYANPAGNLFSKISALAHSRFLTFVVTVVNICPH